MGPSFIQSSSTHAENPFLPHGLVQPGDVLICIADEWHQPTELFVEQIDFGEISRWLTEEGDRPMTLRFERYPQAGWWPIHAHYIEIRLNSSVLYHISPPPLSN